MSATTTAAPPTGTAFEEALENASRGWPVIVLHRPLTFGPKKGPGRATCSCRRLDCESQGKHPRTRNGLKDGTTELATIEGWEARWPSSNYGYLTGVTFDVLDVDGEAGDRALGDIARAAGDPEMRTDGPMVSTGKGWHLLFQPTGEGNRTAIVDQVDWRGRGGYIAGAGSVHHATGRRYEWLPGLGPDTPLEPVPPRLMKLLEKPTAPPDRAPAPDRGRSGHYAQRALEAEVGRLALAQPGARNDTLNRAAFSLGQLIGGGELDPHDVAGALLSVAQRIGLTDHEAVATITSGMGRGVTLPRRRPA